MARRGRWSGMLSGRDPVAMLEALVTAGHPLGRGLRSRLPPGPRRPRWWPRPRSGWAWRSPWPTSPGEAVELAVGRAGPDDRIVVCGSLYVVADARRLLLPDVA